MSMKSCTSSPELFSSYLAAPPKNEVLQRLNQLIDWSRLRQMLATTYADNGRRGFDGVVLLKILLLEKLYNLSDVQVVEEVRDRLSFREFLQLATNDSVPDDTTLVKFRKRLREANMFDRLFEEIHAQMATNGVSVKPGSIKVVDASLIQAAVNKPPKAKEGEQPEPPRDPDADCTVRKGKPFYGYKLHVAQDRESGLVTRHIVTPASVADTDKFQELLSGDEREVLADKGYTSKANAEFLRSNGTRCSVMYRAARKHPLTPWKTARNRSIARIRSFVEGVFADLKRWRRCGRAVYVGLQRVTDQLTLGVLTYNLMRYVALQQEKCA